MAMPTRQLVLKKLTLAFPDPVTAAEALQALDHYGKNANEPCVDGVHFAIIKLCAGQLGRLRVLVKAARRDFRDVLYPAQAPEEFQRLRQYPPPCWGEIRGENKLTPAKQAAMEKRDRKQWAEWLGS